MFNLDPAKLLVIGVIALVVLGPERLPRVARQLGHAWRELTRIRDQVTDEVRTAFPLDDLPRIPSVGTTISTAVGSFADSARGATSTGTHPEEPPDPRPRSQPRSIRRAPEVVVHPHLGEFAFVPDDPSMN